MSIPNKHSISPTTPQQNLLIGLTINSVLLHFQNTHLFNWKILIEIHT